MKAIPICLVLLLAVVCPGYTNEPSRDTPPNILLIMTDDQGWFDAGFNGNPTLLTPNLDFLAGEGITFTRFYSASAVCSPTRASVITGRNPNRMGIPTANSGHMRIQEITLAELLKENGYTTGHFGKWHLGTLTQKSPDANRGGREKHQDHFSIPSMHGYDEFFCTESKVPTCDPMIRPATFNEGESLRYGWTAVTDGASIVPYNTAYWVGHEEKAITNLEGENTRVIMDRLIPFMKKSVNKAKPFFATFWPHTPHLPVVATEEFKNLYPTLSPTAQLYFGSINAMDAQMGRLWKELETLGIADNTLIWFCSDNGPENGTPGSSGPYRGRKRSLHEGGLRTPAFLVWKDRFDGGQQVDFPAFTSDYLPTLLALLEIPYPDDRPLDGINLLPYLENPGKVREKPMGFRYKNQVSWVNHRYKLISKDEGEHFELYDLLQDKSEQQNLHQDLPEMASAMQKELERWLISVENSNKGKDY